MGRFILSCFVGDVAVYAAVLRKLARLNKKIPRNYDSKRKFVGFFGATDLIRTGDLLITSGQGI
jgi:hypothetical protein